MPAIKEGDAGEIIHPPPESRQSRGSSERFSLLFIFRNDTNETVYFTDERLDRSVWDDNMKPPRAIAPRRATTFMLGGFVDDSDANGSIWFRIGEEDSYQINVDFQLRLGGNQPWTYGSYMQRNPGTRYEAGWDAWKDGNDVDLDVMLSYHNERDKPVPGTFLDFSPSVVNFKGKLWTFQSGWKDTLLWYNVGVDRGGAELEWRGDKAFEGTRIGSSPSAVVVDDGISVFYLEPVALFIGKLAYLVVREDGSASNPRILDDVMLAHAPSTVLYKDLIYVFYTEPKHGKLVWISFTKDMKEKQRGEVSDFTIAESPSAVVEGDIIHIFYQASSRDGSMWHTRYDGTNWSNPDRLENIGMSFSPAAIYDKAFGKLVVFHHAYKEREQLWHCRYDKTNSKKTSDSMVVNLKMTHSPSPVIYGDDKIYCFHNGAGGTHELYYKALLRKDM